MYPSSLWNSAEQCLWIFKGNEIIGSWCSHIFLYSWNFDYLNKRGNLRSFVGVAMRRKQREWYHLSLIFKISLAKTTQMLNCDSENSLITEFCILRGILLVVIIKAVKSVKKKFEAQYIFKYDEENRLRLRKITYNELEKNVYVFL